MRTDFLGGTRKLAFGREGGMGEKQVCFVVMGFGKKTDYPTGRVIDLDKSYHYIIKPAAEEAGLECIRADEIIHSGTCLLYTSPSPRD